jgi:hypothetical protein
MFIIYHPVDDDRHLTREEALDEIRRLLPQIESVQLTSGFQPAGRGYRQYPLIGSIALILHGWEEDYEDHVSFHSDEFVTKEIVMEFVREAGLVELMEKEPYLLS